MGTSTRLLCIEAPRIRAGAGGATVTFKERDVCGHKAKFSSRKQAKGAIRSFRKKDNLHPYFCEFCFHWHLGHGERERPRGRG